MVDGDKSVEIMVTIVTIEHFNNGGSQVLILPPSVNLPPEGTNVSVETTNARGYKASETKKIKQVTAAIVVAALQMNVDARVAIALGIKESKLGTGGQIDGNKAPWKDPVVNPLQLSAACKGCPPRAKSGFENQGYNIRGALQVYKDLGGSIIAYGGEGLAVSQRGYSAGVRGYYNAISDTTSRRKVCLSALCW
jgi:hypothetical protein